MNVQGSIDLLKLELSGVATIKGKKCVVIPIEENDIYLSADENLKVKSAYLGLNVNERREVSKFGKTHYCKQSLSKEFRKALSPEEVERRKIIYLGDFKMSKIGNAGDSADVPEVKIENDDDLPF